MNLANLDRSAVDWIFLLGLVLPMVIYNALLVRAAWRREREEERQVRRNEMKEAFRLSLREEIPIAFRIEVLKCIPRAQGGTMEDGNGAPQA